MARFELDRLVSYDDDSPLAELLRVAEIVQQPHLAQSDFDKHSKAASSTIKRRLGGWEQALERAGLSHRFSGGVGGRGSKKTFFTDDELLAELRKVSNRLGGQAVKIELFDQYADINPETVRRRFGSWWAALNKAGRSISKLGMRYSDGDYFENLLAVWIRRGRQPLYAEMEPYMSDATEVDCSREAIYRRMDGE